MKERIKAIMDAEGMNPARFADTLDIGRAVISHILNGRNNPSLDVITRILSKLPQIDSEWLLTGNGTMYKNDVVHEEEPSTNQNALFPDLFAQMVPEGSINSSNHTDELQYRKDNIVNQVDNGVQGVVNERIVYKELPVKKIKQIIIYYTDNTFETFNQ